MIHWHVLVGYNFSSCFLCAAVVHKLDLFKVDMLIKEEADVSGLNHD